MASQERSELSSLMIYVDSPEAMALALEKVAAQGRLIAAAPAHGFAGYYYFIIEPDGLPAGQNGAKAASERSANK